MTTTTELPAGRELDALVAEKVMGLKTRKVRYLEGYSWPRGQLLNDKERVTHFEEALAEEMDDGEVLYFDYGHEPTVRLKLVRRYSTDIAAAWEVVEKLRPDWRFLFQETPGRRWRAAFTHHRYDSHAIADADTAPEAICRAALKAVGA